MWGSIIGAGRLSFRVRDGSGRFPVAMDRRNSIFLFPPCWGWCVLVVGRGGLMRVDGVVASVGKFSAG